MFISVFSHLEHSGSLVCSLPASVSSEHPGEAVASLIQDTPLPISLSGVAIFALFTLPSSPRFEITLCNLLIDLFLVWGPHLTVLRA